MQKLLHGLLFSFWILKLYVNSGALMTKHFSILVFKVRLGVIFIILWNFTFNAASQWIFLVLKLNEFFLSVKAN